MRDAYKNRNVVLVALLMAAVCSCQRSCKSEAMVADGGRTSSASVTSSTEIGIPECDDYLAKYKQCIDDKIPGERRKAFLDAMERTRASWKTLAANSGARPGLPQACQLALQTAQTTMHQYACAW